MILTTQQKNAVDLIQSSIANKQPALLTGFAGTGKSTTITEVVKLNIHRSITIACPTHKASAVVAAMLKEKGVNLDNVKITTIHSALGKKAMRNSGGGLTFTKPSKDIYGLLIVDECSMIDGTAFQELCKASSKASIVFVGDPAQLPPVNGGGISPVFAAINQRAHLSEVIRQAYDNPIIELSVWLRLHLEQCQHVLIPDIVRYVKEIDPTSSKICVISRDDVAGWASDALKNGMDCRYLAFRNDTLDKQINAIRKAVYGGEVNGFVVGEPVSSLSQHGALMNNQECIVTSTGEFEKKHDIVCQHITLDNDIHVLAAVDVVAKQAKQASYFRAHNKQKAQANIATDFNVKAEALKQAEAMSALAWRLSDEIADLRPCVASTVHKAQGSTFDVAIVDVPDIMTMTTTSDILQCLYVAVTRPSEYLVLVV